MFTGIIEGVGTVVHADKGQDPRGHALPRATARAATRGHARTASWRPRQDPDLRHAGPRVRRSNANAPEAARPVPMPRDIAPRIELE